MSRSGYSDDWGDDNWSMICWRGTVASSIRGKRGQAFLRDLLAALEALPEKRLTAHMLRAEGEVCTIGALGVQRGVELEKLDPEAYWDVAAAFNVAEPLVREVVYENDEGAYSETPEQRFLRMRAWVARHLKPEAGSAA